MWSWRQLWRCLWQPQLVEHSCLTHSIVQFRSCPPFVLITFCPKGMNISSAPSHSAGKVGASVPWNPDEPPPLISVPYSDQNPASLYKRDMFHVVKHGVGREATASLLLLLSYLLYFDFPGETKKLPDRLSRGFSMFKLWCETHKKTPSLKNFTKANLHFDKQRSFPYMGGKGSDCTLVLMWLEFFIRCCLLDMKGDHKVLLTAMLQLCQGLLNFLGIMHGHDLWLPRSCAQFMMKQGLQALRAYSFCARECLGINLRLFCMRPKFHSLAHTVFELRAAVRGNHQFILNPCIFNCEQNEDFIGRIARTSRRVSTRLTIYRTLQRYGVSFQSRLRRMRQRRRTHWKCSLLCRVYTQLNFKFGDDLRSIQDPCRFMTVGTIYI